MEAFQVLSFNVNGLNIPSKRRSIFEELRGTKAEICLLQETHCVSSIESLWANEWGGKAIFSNGSSSSKGTAILFRRDFSPNISKVARDPNGRFILVDLVMGEETFTVGSLYAPTQDKPQEQAEFLDSVEVALDSMTGVNVILGGDFNCILNTEIDKNSLTRLTPASEPYRNRLHSFMEDRGLQDIYRIRNQSKKAFTFRRGSYASRLDLILLSSHLSDGTSRVEIKPSAQSDHSMVTAQLCGTRQIRGPGFWKLSPTLLENDKYVRMMTEFLTQWTPPQELSNPCSVWEWLKYEIKTASIQFSKENIPMEKQMIRQLSKDLQALQARADAGEDVTEQMTSTRRELAEIEEIRANKLISRARARWTLWGEKPSAYYLNLEKRKSRNKNLSSILLRDGAVTSDPPKILEECRTFYEALYEEDTESLMPLEELVQRLEHQAHPTISEQESATLESPVTREELRKALHQLNKNKCPGTDGLCPEFYLKFWELISPFLYNSLSFSIENGLLSTEQRRGVITLVPKKDVDRRLVANWRPITLLNTDYKILTKVMALRLQTVLDTIVSRDQTGFMKGRFIGDNLRTIQDALHIMRSSNYDGLLLALDFTKAFDTVRWEYIGAILEWYGFGQNFVSLVKLLSTDIESCVINAGLSSRYFKPARGIRQGCCVSPYLFILAVEAMATFIRNNQDIEGLGWGGDNVLKISQFADDSTCFLNNEASLTPLLSFLQEFSSWSGLTINRRKSMILFPQTRSDPPDQIDGIPVVQRVKILGIWFSANNTESENYNWNFRPQLLKIRGVCDAWGLRNISIKGKVTIVNSLLVSLLQYPCSSIFTPGTVFKEYKRLITNFVWNGKRPKVAYDTLTLPIDQGGLNLMDLETRVRVALLQWIRRFIRTPDINSAKSLSLICGTSDLHSLLAYKSIPVLNEGISTPFYTQMLKLWHSVHAFEPADEYEVRQEIVWCNQRIISQGAPLHWPRWERAGISTIQDICHESEDRILSHVELGDRFGVACSFLDMLRLRLSVPHSWRRMLTQDWRSPPDVTSRSGIMIALPGENRMDILNASPKAMYKALIRGKNHLSTAFLHWTHYLEPDLRIADEVEWAEITRSIYKATRETKMQTLHFRILNRIVPCNAFLARIRVKNSDVCERCDEVDSLAHFFYYCPTVSSFRRSAFARILLIEDLPLDNFSVRSFLFGVPSTTPKANKINAILISMKFYIYRQRLFHEGKLDLIHWLREFRLRLLAERDICTMQGTARKFAPWSTFLRGLG